jgi:hypothetical protein
MIVCKLRFEECEARLYFTRIQYVTAFESQPKIPNLILAQISAKGVYWHIDT